VDSQGGIGRAEYDGRSRPTDEVGELLGDDPAGIVDALKAAIRTGAAPADLGRSLADAAALRVARFGNANEHADWETAHHAFTYANDTRCLHGSGLPRSMVT
jgi:hypothetical protein